jgi:hypothetical protein
MLDGIFSKCLLSPFGQWCSLTSVSLLLYFLADLSIDKSGGLKLSTSTISAFICPFMSSSFCFLNLSAPTFSVYNLKLLYLLDGLLPLLILVIFIPSNFGLKSALSDVSIVTLVCF